MNVIKGLLGTRYVWGGNDESGIDCSGFTKAVYEAMGIELPRVSYQQANGGQQVSKDQARMGDLVWWDLNGRNPGADHVGIYMGNGMVAEASSSRGQVVIRPLWGNAQFARYGEGAPGGVMSGNFEGMAATGAQQHQTAAEILAPNMLANQQAAQQPAPPTGTQPVQRPTKEMV